jgi:hypothetical protein
VPGTYFVKVALMQWAFLGRNGETQATESYNAGKLEANDVTIPDGAQDGECPAQGGDVLGGVAPMQGAIERRTLKFRSMERTMCKSWSG